MVRLFIYRDNMLSSAIDADKPQQQQTISSTLCVGGTKLTITVAQGLFLLRRGDYDLFPKIEKI
jgi:hypothetical protein